jgi:hypothetical protein
MHKLKMMPRSVPDVLPFPLYHGTSSVWRASIIKHGLGGRRIVEELHAVDFCRAALGSLASLPADRQPEILEPTKRIASQQVTEGGFNFRHGGAAYVTPSRSAALRYAGNYLGSEILTECESLYRAVMFSGGGSEPSWLREYPELRSVLRFQGSPMIVRIRGVRAQDLLTEDGRKPDEQLLALLDEWDQAAVLGKGQTPHLTPEEVLDLLQDGFQLCIPYPVSDFDLEEVGREDPMVRG